LNCGSRSVMPAVRNQVKSDGPDLATWVLSPTGGRASRARRSIEARNWMPSGGLPKIRSVG
jgi:hypothetical protein